MAVNNLLGLQRPREHQGMKMDEVLRLATDGPWGVQRHKWDFYSYSVIDPGTCQVALIMAEVKFENQAANAALIIRARNTFVDAVEALEKMINIADGSEPCVGEDFKLKLAQARATLARMMEDV